MIRKLTFILAHMAFIHEWASIATQSRVTYNGNFKENMPTIFIRYMLPPKTIPLSPRPCLQGHTM